MRKLHFLPLLLLCSTVISAETGTATLAGPWLMTTRDSVRNALPETSTATWNSVTLPGSLKSAGVYWLRRSFTADPGRYNYAFESGPVFDSLSVYINGRLVGTESQFVSTGRPLVIPVPGSYITNGNNTIAVRLKSVNPLYTGIEAGSFSIRPLENATKHYFRSMIAKLVYSLTFISVCIFFFMLFRKNRETLYILAAAGCSIVSFHYLSGSELMALITQGFSLHFYPLFASLLPVAFLPFIFHRSETSPPGFLRLIYITALGIAVLSTGASLFFTVALSRLLLMTWHILTIPVVLYGAYVLVQYTMKKPSAELVILVTGFVLTALHFLTELVSGHFLVPVAGSSSALLAAGILAVPVSLLYRVVSMQKEAEEGETRMQTVDTLQTMIFHHIDTGIARPVLELTSQLKQKNEVTEKQYESVSYNIKEIDGQLNNILELSRLEVLDAPETGVEINVKDFLESILPHTDVTYTMRVDSDLVFDTSLELVNSLVMRLVDFPGFKTFRHIDLIITSDLNQNLHFRFLMQQSDLKTVRRLYSILTNKMPDVEGLWVEWSIIQETIRILSGDLEVKILNKKFLCTDITLPAHKRGEENTDFVPEVSVYVIQETGEMPAVSPDEESAVTVSKEPEIQLSPNMTPGQLVQWIRQKFRKT